MILATAKRTTGVRDADPRNDRAAGVQHIAHRAAGAWPVPPDTEGFCEIRMIGKNQCLRRPTTENLIAVANMRQGKTVTIGPFDSFFQCADAGPHNRNSRPFGRPVLAGKPRYFADRERDCSIRSIYKIATDQALYSRKIVYLTWWARQDSNL